MKRRVVVIAAGAAVVLGACGSSSPEESVDDTLPDANELVEDAESLGITPLALAFDQAADAAGYRAEIAMGMTMSLGSAGTIDFPADPSTPMSFVEVDAQGEQHTSVDLAPMMNALLAASGLGDGVDATGIFGGDLSMETWMAGSTITIDVGGFAPILQQNTGAAGVLPGEVFTVDLDRLAAGLGAPEVAASMTGQAAPDPAEMAIVLREALGDAEAVDADRYAGTLTLAEYSAAFGQDIDALLERVGAASSVPEADAASLQRLFDEVTVDVDVTLADGVVDTLYFDLDMSDVIGSMVGQVGGEDAAAEGTLVITMLMDYDIDPTIDVVVPTGDFPDGTDQYLQLFGQG
jgi:hypothetical protein